MRVQIVRLSCSVWHLDYLTTPDRQAAAFLNAVEVSYKRGSRICRLDQLISTSWWEFFAAGGILRCSQYDNLIVRLS